MTVTTVGYLLDRYPVLSQTFVSNEIEEMRRQGVTVVVSSLWAGDASADADRPAIIIRETRPGKRRGVVHHILAMLHHPLRYVRFLATVHALGDEAAVIGWRRLPSVACELRLAGVDRLHAHFAWGGAGAAAALSALTGWPWAMTVHARDIFADRRNLDLKLGRTNLLITVCDYNRRYLLETLGVTTPISLVICGVTVPAVAATGVSDLGIVFVGRMVEKKGVDVLLRAVAELRTRHPDLKVDLVGDGPLLEPMRALATSLELDSVVTFRGPVSHVEVLELVSRATVLCLPARVAADGDVDSMPLVIKEAMVRNIAVAGCDVGGVGEMISDGCGELVPPEDSPALAAALHRLIADEGHRRDCVTRARARAVERFTLDGQVAKLRGLLEALTH